MCLHPASIESVPKATIRIARAAFPKGNLYLSMRDDLGTFFSDEDFAGLYPKRGQPAFAPWRLALVTVFQFAENLSGRRRTRSVPASTGSTRWVRSSPTPASTIPCWPSSGSVWWRAAPPNAS